MVEKTNDFSDLCSRFVDGELSHKEENHVLAMCEQFPEHYRTLALAIVEDRRIGQLLKDGDGSDGMLDQPGFWAADSGEIPNRIVKRSKRSRWLPITALAGCLLAGIAVGYGVRGLGAAGPNASSDVAATTGPEGEQSILSTIDATKNADPKEPGFLESELNGKDSFVSLARQLKPTHTLDDQAVRLLTNNGVDVRRHRHVFLFDVSDGRQLAIPAEFTFLSTSSR